MGGVGRELPTVGGAQEATLALELAEDEAEAVIVDPEPGAEGGAVQGLLGPFEQLEDRVGQALRWGRGAVGGGEQFEVGGAAVGSGGEL